jgi:hypothetical protein
VIAGFCSFGALDHQRRVLHQVYRTSWKIGIQPPIIVVTCHFIDAEWKLQKRIIKFIDVKTPHTGVELFNNIQNCIQDWSIEDKLFGITLDNAAANNTMIDLLRHNLVDMKFLPAQGELLHHRCAGHVINLIVKDGLRVVESIVVNIHESVKHICGSQSRKQMFKGNN